MLNKFMEEHAYIQANRYLAGPKQSNDDLRPFLREMLSSYTIEVIWITANSFFLTRYHNY